MKPYILLALFFISFTPKSYSQSEVVELMIGYNATSYYRGLRQLSIEQHQFNSIADNPDTPFKYSNILHGPEIGFGGRYNLFSFNMAWRMRKIKAKGSHTSLTGTTINYKELKLTHNVFVMGILIGDPWGRFRFGYEVEMGMFKRRDKLAPDDEWEKLRSGTWTYALNLVSMIRLGGSEEEGGLIIKPYWRFSSRIYRHFYDKTQLTEYYSLQAFGVSALITINPNR